VCGRPDHFRIRAEAALPVAVGQHECRRRAVPLVVVAKRPPEDRLHAEHVEEVRRHDARRDPLRVGAPEEDEPHAVELDDAVDGVGPPVVEDFLIGERHGVHACQRPLLAQDEQVLAALVGERLLQDTVHDAEDRAVGPDAERHRRDDDQREAGVLRERPRAVADVVRERLDQAPRPGVAHFLLHTGRIAERVNRRAAGVVGRGAAADVLLGLHLDVEAQLGLELPVLPAEEERSQARQHVRPPPESERRRRQTAPSAPFPRRAGDGPSASARRSAPAGCSPRRPIRP